MRTGSWVVWVICCVCLTTVSACPLGASIKQPSPTNQEERIVLSAIKLLRLINDQHHLRRHQTRKRNMGTVDSLYNLPDLLYRGRK